jgi:hypothetical protein
MEQIFQGIQQLDETTDLIAEGVAAVTARSGARAIRLMILPAYQDRTKVDIIMPSRDDLNRSFHLTWPR